MYSRPLDKHQINLYGGPRSRSPKSRRRALGSILIDSANTPLREDRNRTHTLRDATRHPEFELARWAAANMDAADRDAATVYTSGEHCAMCSAAHAWAGLGRIVYVASMDQLNAWLEEFRLEMEKKGVAMGEASLELPVAPLSIQSVAPGVEVQSPVPELETEIKALHRRCAGLGP
ncbi:cytidine/deoxycytidylate deaminase [Xylaria sp. FL0933]|nr:cytidine/deoxycytidylate deaminase [Xylaria sp. FL0933]